MTTKTKPAPVTVTLLREQIEVGFTRNGRPGYRWTQGYYVCDPAKGEPLGNAKIYPPMIRREAYAFAREIGGAGCKVVIAD